MKQITFLSDNIMERYKCYDRFELLTPYKNNPVLSPDKPWEDNCVAYPSIIYDKEENIYKCWYMSQILFNNNNTDHIKLIDNVNVSSYFTFICYAVSNDGINWTKPKLNILHSDIYPDNNIVYFGMGPSCGCSTVIYEPFDKFNDALSLISHFRSNEILYNLHQNVLMN